LKYWFPPESVSVRRSPLPWMIRSPEIEKLRRGRLKPTAPPPARMTAERFSPLASTVVTSRPAPITLMLE
jgi:hypothetical protein